MATEEPWGRNRRGRYLFGSIERHDMPLGPTRSVYLSTSLVACSDLCSRKWMNGSGAVLATPQLAKHRTGRAALDGRNPRMAEHLLAVRIKDPESLAGCSNMPHVTGAAVPR